ncbi:hypothetical protein DYB30_013928, partial [Aphanomyces astaci]
TRNDISVSIATRQQSTTVQDLRDNRLAESSQKGYRSGVKQITIWMQASGRAHMLNADGSINLELFGYGDFTEFVLHKYKNSGVTLSTLSGYRSALKDYYNKQNVPLPNGFGTDATVIYQGIRRLCASETQAGAIKSGTKQPLRHHQYLELCKASLSKMDAGFTHLFLVLSWNLMCRSRSTATIRIDHISDEGDALGVMFFKSKTDQGGTKRRDPKHVYANPMQPETCCILALAVYLACNPEHDSGSLFPGAAQRDRFGRSLSQLVGVTLPAAAKVVGTHSLRKGAATYAIGGSTSGPSIVNVCIRCGWSIGSVVERYVHYDGAGDQFVGRVVAGLPLASASFAVLPPHFVAGSSDAANATGALVFPRLWVHPTLRGVLSLCLASLVHHKAFLVTALPPKHPLLSSVLFGDASAAAILRANVTLTSQTMQPTGIPPHVDLHSQLDQNLAVVRALPSAIRESIEQLLDEKGVTAGNITHAMLEQLLRDTVATIVSVEPANNPSHSQVVEDMLPARPVHYWGGRWHLLPETFELPSVDVATAWHLWWCGSPARDIPPLIKISSRDLTKKQGKIFCEWNFAVVELQKVYNSATGTRMSRPFTSALVIAAFTTIMENLSLSWGQTQLGRQRRLTQMKMVTFARLARKRRRDT